MNLKEVFKIGDLYFEDGGIYEDGLWLTLVRERKALQTYLNPENLESLLLLITRKLSKFYSEVVVEEEEGLKIRVKKLREVEDEEMLKMNDLINYIKQYLGYLKDACEKFRELETIFKHLEESRRRIEETKRNF